MRLILAAFLLLQAKEDAAQPAPRTKEYSWMSTAAWKQRHEANVKKPKDAELVFVGDSITEGWGNNAVWQKHYPKAMNLGIGGDTTQNVLWRLENGEVEGLAPKVVVVMIGTNNFGLNGDPPKDVVRGVVAVVQSLRKKLPKAKVLLLGIFPRDANPKAGIRDSIKKVNEEIARLDDKKNVRFLDIGAKFLAPDGSIAKEVMPDALHLSEKGYEIWADAMNPLLGELTK
jgi:lysophospholipase L1-like esterase